MRRRTLSALLALLLTLSLVLPAEAQPVQRRVSYQGVLFLGGSPVTTNTSLTFALFTNAACTSAFPSGSPWSQTLSVTPDAAGVFSALLGSNDPSNAAFFAFAFDRALFLKTSIGGVQVACQALAAVPYALGLYGMRVEPETATEGPNVIGGWSGNSVGAGVEGATISGGGDPDFFGNPFPNEVTGNYATVGGGVDNTASGFATVGGGSSNTASGSNATVGGGSVNTASGEAATVGGGLFNTLSGASATVGGGANNRASEDYATVGGGQLNTASADYATVGGGEDNTASGLRATVGGGESNTASSSWATVGGGFDNTASGFYATVSGGRLNTADGDQATVGGGVSNTASGFMATVGGGSLNTASGQRATVGGGRLNQAGGDYSFAAGRRAIVRDAATVGDTNGDEGTFLWADATNADFTSTGPNQFFVRASGGTTFFSNAALTAGVTLAAGGNAWASVSDSTRKEGFLEADGERFLQEISTMRLGSWNYRGQDPARFRHYGAMAQDFFAAFGHDGVGVIGTDTTLSTGDVDGVLMIAVQALAARTAALQEAEAEVAALRTEMAQQQARIEALETERGEVAVLRAEMAQQQAEVAALRALVEGKAGASAGTEGSPQGSLEDRTSASRE